MVSKKAIIFDCDGTLVDSEEAHFAAWNFALQKQEVPTLPFEEYVVYVGGAVDKTAKLLSIKNQRLCPQMLIKDKNEYFIFLRQRGLAEISSTIAFIRQLASKKEALGLKLAIASAAHREEVLFHVKKLGIESAFDLILSGVDDLTCYSDPEGVNKPKPYIYLEAAKRLSCLPSQCVVVEDSCHGIRAGVDAGCTVIAVPNKYTSQQDLSSAHLRIKSFDEVSIDKWPFCGFNS